MKISASFLARYIQLPDALSELRMLFDDIGIEVKRSWPDTGLFSLELLANRGDHHSYIGIAREIGGRTSDKLHTPDIALRKTGTPPLPLVLNTKGCLLYSATLLVRSGEGTPLTTDEMGILDAAEIHSVSTVVDATNLANLELGQPTHCFDADTINGAITIRDSRPGEMAWPLFATERVAVPEGTVVICDDEKILAIAGVIGCEESKATADTTRVLLESAAFDPVAVRQASRAMAIATDSSARFERGSDPTAVITGAGRVVKLLEAHGWKREGDTGLVGDWKDEARCISINTQAVARFLDHPIDTPELTERLERYGFSVDANGDDLSVQVPPHRVWDVEFAADLYEEIAKSIGYNDTATNLPHVDMGALPSAPERMKRAVEEVLLGAGFYEVFTNGFHATDMQERLGLADGHRLTNYIQTTNALDRGYGLIKNNCLAQAVEAVAANTRMGTRPIQMYEWTRTFHPDASADNGVCTERHVLWAIAAGDTETNMWATQARTASAWFLKGVVEEIATALSLDLQVGPADPHNPLHDCMHPGRTAAIVFRGETVGIMGEVHPRIVAAFKLKRSRPVYLEIDRAALLSKTERPRYQERSIHQPINRSLAFSLPPKVSAGAIVNTMKDAGPSWLDAVDIVDLFEHEADGIAMRAVTFSLRYSNDSGDRSAEAVNQSAEALIATVLAQFGERGVSLRA